MSISGKEFAAALTRDVTNVAQKAMAVATDSAFAVVLRVLDLHASRPIGAEARAVLLDLLRARCR